METIEKLIKLIGGYIAVWLAITAGFFIAAWATCVLFDVVWKSVTHNDGFVICFVMAHLIGMVIGLIMPIADAYNEA